MNFLVCIVICLFIDPTSPDPIDEHCLHVKTIQRCVRASSIKPNVLLYSVVQLIVCWFTQEYMHFCKHAVFCDIFGFSPEKHQWSLRSFIIFCLLISQKVNQLNLLEFDSVKHGWQMLMLQNLAFTVYSDCLCEDVMHLDSQYSSILLDVA